jgi:tRNA threonylcarbamoyladenosine modification (KEOPS) complex  Pcc1 subunit
LNIQCEIILTYESEKQARHIQQVLTIDDGSFVSSAVKDNNLIARIEQSALSSFLHTLDDYLACITVAENIIKTTADLKDIYQCLIDIAEIAPYYRDYLFRYGPFLSRI